MAMSKQTPRPTLEEVRRRFEKTRDQIRQNEDRAKTDLPRRPPGGSDPGSAPPSHPRRP
jgi:hypothetical protein